MIARFTFTMRSSIVALFKHSRPATIVRGIVPVVVDAIKGQFRVRLPAHIGKEVLKGLQPAVADRNPSTSVVCITHATRVIAPVEHVLPCVVLAGASQPMPSNEEMIMVPSPFAAQARTTLAVATSQVGTDHMSFCAAVATTKPDDFPAFVTPFFGDDEKSVKTLADKVNLVGHQERSSLGVMGQDVSASLPFYFTRSECRA